MVNQSGHLDADITGLLLEWRSGDRSAIDRLLPLVYAELRKIAQRQLGHERADHTLSTTALVHEAYLKLVDQTRAQWEDRKHFFAIAAQAMRRILVDYARQHRAAKRSAIPVDLDAELLLMDERAGILVVLDDALTDLAEVDVRLARIVELRFFGGLTEEEIAESLGLTARTVRRDWVKAKAWLRLAVKP
ncbi:MAG TPA: sigma-70 family RNA polymerase sigma factor [Gemmatimonadaceae bacterium]|nr:sigma-70 family RNA polymerase sigma factor [Gemmatimonadaceae bacterium]